MSNDAQRPKTLASVAAQVESIEDFGYAFRDWLHEVRHFSSRPQVENAVADCPQVLAGRFTQGDVADVWLAAYAELICARAGIPAPAWASDAAHQPLGTPWFSWSEENEGLRIITLRDTPSAFKARNIFSGRPELPLRLRAGRPRVRRTQEEKRNQNAAHQRAFRERRKQELAILRQLSAKDTLQF